MAIKNREEHSQIKSETKIELVFFFFDGNGQNDWRFFCPPEQKKTTRNILNAPEALRITNNTLAKMADCQAKRSKQKKNS